MPPKRGKKRKNASTGSTATATTNGTAAQPPPPDRATWPGWVEMESEPAFFNVMLREMGVKGVKLQDVVTLDDMELLTLPQPVHALIFLFRYKETDAQHQETGSCPNEVWFANQTPDFACATFALLNIVNNIPGLDLGKDLREFKTFTQDMEPLLRGDAVDNFDFVKHIHNSFASDSDLLQADMFMKNKNAKFKKQQATIKARATKAAKKAEDDALRTIPQKEKPADAAVAGRTSGRQKKPTSKKSPKESSRGEGSDVEYVSPKKKAKTEEEIPEKDDQANRLRRSQREPKPRKDTLAAAAALAAERSNEEEGFHFLAYMPINGHLWKLDGLDRFPQDMGAISDGYGGSWMSLAQSLLQGRMTQYQESDISFSLMAVVHDALSSDRAALLENIRTLQAIDKKLDGVYEDWRSIEGAETKKEVIVDMSSELGISAADVDAALSQPDMAAKMEKVDDVLELVVLRKQVLSRQTVLRDAVREARRDANQDEAAARQRRHDYGKFVRSWLGELDAGGVLEALVDGKPPPSQPDQGGASVEGGETAPDHAGKGPMSEKAEVADSQETKAVSEEDQTATVEG